MMSKKLIPFLLILCCFSAFGKPYANLYQKLVEVNAQWAFQSDIPDFVYKTEAILDEREAIRMHLQCVEQNLRARPNFSQTLQQQTKRLLCLDKLREYWQAGVFPQNDYLPYRNPVFIDKQDNFCAVGFLVKETGYESISQAISETQNFAYVYEIQNNELVKWANEYGFTLAELAWIQPGYPPTKPTLSMQNGLGGKVYDMIPTPDSPDLMWACGDFSDKVSLWYPGFAGFDWISQATIGGGNVYAIENFNNNYQVIGGDFTSIGGMNVYNIAMLAPNGFGFFPMGTLNGTVRDLKMYKNELYAAGTFGVAKWDGNSAWQGVFLPVSGSAYTLHVWAGDLYIGGDFYENNYHNIIRYDGTTLHPLGNGLLNPVYAIGDFKNRLFAAGLFDAANQEGYVWKYENNLWEAAGDKMTGNAVYALENVHDSTLFVGGDFDYYPLMGYWGKNLINVLESSGFFYLNGIDELNAPVRVIKNVGDKVYVGGDFTGNGAVNNLNGVGYFTFATVGILPISDVEVSLYPNPASTHLVCTLPQGWEKEVTEVVFTDLAGKVVFRKSFSAQKAIEIPVSALLQGVYLLRISSAKGEWTGKWIKE